MLISDNKDATVFKVAFKGLNQVTKNGELLECRSKCAGTKQNHGRLILVTQRDQCTEIGVS